MSNYFQVLKKIEQDRSGRRADARTEGAPEEHPSPDASPAATRSLRALSTSPSPAAIPTAAPAPPPPAAPPVGQPTPSMATTAPRALRPAARPEPEERPQPVPHEATPEPQRPAAGLSEESKRGIATLFDNIRAMASARATRTIVFAGAAPSDSVHAVSDGLARHAGRHGMQAFVAHLAPGERGPRLIPRTAEHGREPFDIDLNGGAAPGQLNAWIDAVCGGSDLVILEGPPLAEAIDAALLACACDGLVIVADAEVTPRAALQKAAERAQIAGCHTLGVVMTGAKDRTPSWMRRLIGSEDRRPRKGTL